MKLDTQPTQAGASPARMPPAATSAPPAASLRILTGNATPETTGLRHHEKPLYKERPAAGTGPQKPPPALPVRFCDPEQKVG